MAAKVDLVSLMAANQQLADKGEEIVNGWSRQRLLDLVDAYQTRPCLYDNTCPGYHNREERARSWIEIADILGKEEEVVRAKMKSIRTQYARIIQKGQHPKSKTGNTVSSWWLLEALSFLDDFISPRKADSESIKENDIDLSHVSQVGRKYHEDNSLDNGDMVEMMYDEMPPESDMHVPVGQVHGTTQSNSINSAVQSQVDDVTLVNDNSPYQSPYPRHISPRPVTPPSISTYRSSSSRMKVRKASRPLKRLRREVSGSPVAAVRSRPARKPDGEGAMATGNSSLLLKTVLAFVERGTRDEDDDAVFGRYVGNEMRTMTDLQAKRIAKMRIQKVLFEAQTGWTETSSEGVYHAPREESTAQENFPVGVVCGTNNSRVMNVTP